MKTFVHILLFAFIAFVGSSQEVVEVVHIEKDDGLKHRVVNRVIRDNQGYFILFFLNTIQRYDGREFTNIDVSVFGSNNLEVGGVDYLDKLADGTIVMSENDSGLLFYLPPKGNTILEAPLRGRPFVNNNTLYVIKPGLNDTENFTLHSATLDGKVLSEVISNVHLPDNIQDIAVLDDLYYFQDDDGNIFHLENERLTKLDVRGKIIQRNSGIYIFDKNAIFKIAGQKSVRLFELEEGDFNCGILKLDGEDNIVAAYSRRPRFYDMVYVLDKNDVLHLKPEITGVSDLFKDFYTDDAFYRWMIVGYNGLRVINLLRDGSYMIDKRSTTKKGEFGAVVSGVAASKQEVVFCRELKGVYNIDHDTKEKSEILTSYTQNGNYDRNSKLYYHEASKCYYSNSYRYDGKSDIYKTDIVNNTSKRHLIPIKLNDIYVRGVDDLVIGGFISKTNTGIIATYNLKSKKYTVILDNIPQVRSIYFDKLLRQYWVGTYNGLFVYDDGFNLLETFSKSIGGARFISVDHVIMCHRFNGKILAGTYGGGVFIIDPKTYVVEKELNEESGLTDNAAIGLINDDLGNCWVTTFNGVNVIDDNFDVIRKIYEHDGLTNREYNSKAIAKDRNGVIYAGTLNGVSALDPKKVLKWKKTLDVDIIEILGFENEVVERLMTTNDITLLEGFDSIQIKYNLPDYHKYPYVLEPLDVQHEGSLDVDVKDDVITIKNLGIGEYSLLLKPEGREKTTLMKITRKYNYQRYLVWLFSFLLLVGFTFMVSKWIIKNNRQREEEKTRLNKKISDLQLSSLQSQMNPHFIFNALGAVQYFIQTHDTEKADEYLSNFAMLMRSILESSKSKYIRLNEELRLLDLYIGLEKVRFEELFDYNLKIDVNVDTEVNIPPMIIQPFVENAINHGLYNLKGRKGKLLVHFGMPSEDLLVITITDNGVGRKRAAELRMKKHKSRGTQIVQERLETINLGNELIVTTETIDLYNDKESIGTKVIVNINSSEG